LPEAGAAVLSIAQAVCSIVLVWHCASCTV